MNGHKLYNPLHPDLWKSKSEFAHNSPILFQDCRGKQKLNLTITPGFKNLIRGPFKEDARNENIRVEDNSHLWPRTLATATLTSDLFNPALRACRLARPIRSLNSLTGGDEMALRITTSRFPMTTNCVPAFNPRRPRISSGMTTCPLEDMQVVAKLSMDASFLTGKIIDYSNKTVKEPVLKAAKLTPTMDSGR